MRKEENPFRSGEKVRNPMPNKPFRTTIIFNNKR